MTRRFAAYLAERFRPALFLFAAYLAERFRPALFLFAAYLAERFRPALFLFAAYLAERFRPALFIPAIVLHVLLALWAAGAEPTAARLVAAAGVTTLLLLQFRLWDDLEDRDRDRAAHPERVLARTSPAPFRRALVAIGLGNFVALAAAPSAAALTGLVVLDAAFFAAYRLRARASDRVWRFGLLLAKYPSFVGLVAAAAGAPRTFRLALAMAAMYAAASLYEACHDRRGTTGALP